MKEERRKQMENLIAQRQNITMEELRSIFDVSMNTKNAMAVSGSFPGSTCLCLFTA